MNKSKMTKALEEISFQESLLAKLDSQREAISKHIEVLRDRLKALDPETESLAGPSPVCVPRILATSQEKVALFRQLFRGREDVFPTLWGNQNLGKKGYAPACRNEWIRGVCEKPRVRCGECPSQAFIPVSDQIILDHLQGRRVVGVYPLLQDETCWFLAVDFDKRSWTDDVLAFVRTCRLLGIPVAVERSRSGNGAHAWFFFVSPISAEVARKMGCYLLTETMSRHHQLAMDSYDRLFPNQDTLPRGGFGNLIALPLQHGPRRSGNTVFVDDSLVPYVDQWAHLASLPKIAPAIVQEIAREAARKAQVLGVRAWEPTEPPDGTTSAFHSTSGQRPSFRVTATLPRQIKAVLAQRLFVEKEGLPSSLLNQIKRLAAFQNPEFYKKQRMRLSTATTPRLISCAEELSGHIALPRNCRVDLEALLLENRVDLVVDDQRQDGESLTVRFRGDLTEIQKSALRALLEHESGVLVAPPGIGKTVVAIRLIAERARTALVLVHRQPLLDQWISLLSWFLGMEAKEIGQMGAGKRRMNGRLDVAMLQSLARRGRIDDIVAQYGHVVVDECHHIPAFSFERVLAEAKARFLTGLTATPRRRDGHDPIVEMYLGSPRFVVGPKSEAARHPFEQHLIVRETGFRPQQLRAGAGIQEVYEVLAADEDRNAMILDDVIRSLEEGRSPILLTERKSHLSYFASRLRGFTRHLVILKGGATANERRRALAELASIPAGEERLVLATGRYIGEGFDDSRLDTLFLALPISWKGTLTQYAGRLHRLHPGKTDVRIFDYVDSTIPVLRRMFEKRLSAYRAIGYARDEAPLGYAEPKDEPWVEWDPEALEESEDSPL